jgi:hypothetical protein
MSYIKYSDDSLKEAAYEKSKNDEKVCPSHR